MSEEQHPLKKPFPKEKEREKLSIFQLFLLVLSVYVLGALFVQSMFTISPEMSGMLDNIDFFICLIFLSDFFYRLYHAKSKLRFLRWGWIDFISSIPMLNIFRTGNMFRIVRVLRLLRAFRSIKILLKYLMRNRGKNTFVTVAAVSCLITMSAAILILNVEKEDSNANIKTPSDALWWSIVTITTVGYGDRYPVTDTGRIIAAVLMTAGVGLFGTFTGFVASMFVEPDIEQEKTEINRLVREIRALRRKVNSLEQVVTGRKKKAQAAHAANNDKQGQEPNEKGRGQGQGPKKSEGQ